MKPTVEQLEGLIRELASMFDGRRESLPGVEPIPPESIPLPERDLLVHDSDMTPTLEEFYNCKLTLRVLHSDRQGDLFRREVLLIPEGEDIPVIFGAIRIHLDKFDPAPRREIVDCLRPLGSILIAYDVPRQSHPDAYFKLAPNAVIREWLALANGDPLFGRCNVIRNPAGEILAEIVEILPRPRQSSEG